MFFPLLIISLIALVVNALLGAWRVNTRSLSFWWFVAALASLPLIAYLHRQFALSFSWMVLTIGVGVLGQALGARFARKRIVVGRWS